MSETEERRNLIDIYSFFLPSFILSFSFVAPATVTASSSSSNTTERDSFAASFYLTMHLFRSKDPIFSLKYW